jgi:hypothetical protein
MNRSLRHFLKWNIWIEKVCTMTTTGSTNSQPTAHSRKYKAPKENAHMSVLGMDGKDLEVSGGSSSTTSLNDNAATVTTKPSEGSLTKIILLCRRTFLAPEPVGGETFGEEPTLP